MPDTEEKYWLSSGILIFVKLIVFILFAAFFKVFNVDGSASSFINELLTTDFNNIFFRRIVIYHI